MVNLIHPHPQFLPWAEGDAREWWGSTLIILLLFQFARHSNSRVLCVYRLRKCCAWNRQQKWCHFEWQSNWSQACTVLLSLLNHMSICGHRLWGQVLSQWLHICFICRKSAPDTSKYNWEWPLFEESFCHSDHKNADLGRSMIWLSRKPLLKSYSVFASYRVVCTWFSWMTLRARDGISLPVSLLTVAL